MDIDNFSLHDPTEKVMYQRVITHTMKNIEMSLNGTILTMKIDISKDFGPSKSGKSITIASTEGNISVPEAEDVKIGVNVYKSNK